ncbi:MAG: hypothetical protein QG590_349, partial [Pseudomonadota bacterium]|nr:hypothetical protein [Pseudomonadota bacterium]
MKSTKGAIKGAAIAAAITLALLSSPGLAAAGSKAKAPKAAAGEKKASP